jgi:hypothetical protein
VNGDRATLYRNQGCIIEGNIFVNICNALLLGEFFFAVIR